MESKIAVVFDTNLWVSFLISKNYSQLDKLFGNDQIILLLSRELLEEYTEVIRRPKFRNYFDDSNIVEVFSLVESYGKLINVVSRTDICRDAKDNFLLDL